MTNIWTMAALLLLRAFTPHTYTVLWMCDGCVTDIWWILCECVMSNCTDHMTTLVHYLRTRWTCYTTTLRTYLSPRLSYWRDPKHNLSPTVITYVRGLLTYIHQDLCSHHMRFIWRFIIGSFVLMLRLFTLVRNFGDAVRSPKFRSKFQLLQLFSF
jgi:hypothetical protein